jgi:arsenate reductase
MIFVCYPKCTTCRKAKQWLEANNIAYTERNIKENHPNIEKKPWKEYGAKKVACLE